MSESLKQLGLISDSTLGDLQQEVSRLRQQVSRLVAGQQVGQLVFGDNIRTNPATSCWSDSFMDLVDNNINLSVKIPVQNYILRIIQLKLRIIPRNIRSPITIVDQIEFDSQEEPDHTHTNATVTGTPSTANTGAGSSHSHGAGSYGVTSHTHTFNWSHSHANDANTGSSNPDTPHAHSLTSTDTSGTGGDTTGSASPSVNGTSSSESSHTHSLSSHTHSIASPTGASGSHVHGIDAHGHAILFEVTEGTTPTSLRLWIDSVDRTAALGGPWTAETEVDITTYFLDSGTPQKPDYGTHLLEVDSSDDGLVEIHLDWYVITKPVGAW